MSREQRLAIVAGFAVFLVVAVLISDHLSRARGVKLADGNHVEAALPAEIVMETPVPPLRSGAVIVSSEVDDAEGLPTIGGGVAAVVDDPERLALAQGGTDDPEHLVIDNGRGPGGEAGDEIAEIGTLERLRQLAKQQGLSEPVVLAKPEERAAASGGEPERAVTPPAAPATYVVRAGDSLAKIAREVLGNESRWRELAALNKDVVDEDDGVRVGVRLTLPGTGATPAAKPKVSRAAEEKATRTYVVKRGDTLGRIAQRQLGSSKRKSEILELNRGKVRDEDAIVVGMALRLPAE